MFFALSMSKVAALIGVQREAKSALVGSDMIPHEIWILGDVDSLKGQLPQPLLSFNVGILVAGNSNTAYPSPRSILPINHLIRESNEYQPKYIILLMHPR